MASSYDSSDEPISGINVVPLVDIILVVLIIFMVTAPMFMKPSINVNLPEAASGDETAPTQLSLTITVDGRWLLNGQSVDEDSLRIRAAEELEANPEVQAVISADRDVAHGRVITALDIIKEVGVRKFAISIDQPSN